MRRLKGAYGSREGLLLNITPNLGVVQRKGKDFIEAFERLNGAAYDQVDEYIRINEATASNCLVMFCNDVIKKFGPEYLREPNQQDIENQLNVNAHRGFLGMFGSVDSHIGFGINVQFATIRIGKKLDQLFWKK
ncbi:unnamed protein product [Calypogeia fissa]